ncbi:hypothetical protein GCM10009038_01940 [Salinicola rhizosphaerae]|uniref:DUF3450 domain-containing protein n=2 Tax=Salinicola rhizosphaerae TaxID=1443141 RepID=A0ABQ3DML6_9GAMM|nr:hypothetical protein GCM10009038_01940 [Salinicola rhizosphaerae]
MEFPFPRKRDSGRRLMLIGLAAFSLAAAANDAAAQDSLSQASIQAQQAQAKLQQRIDSADDKTRQALQTLRQANQQAARLESYNQELAPVVESQAKRLATQRQALAQISVTREALPGEMRKMVEQLRQMIQADMPFLRQERLARVDDLDKLLASDQASPSDKLKQIYSVWRTELDYGREMDQWSGPLDGAQSAESSRNSQYTREVDFLRVGRSGWYYVTPDDRAGGVWSDADQQWEALNGDDIREVRRGIRIAEDQSAPSLLHLPASVRVENGVAMANSENSAAADAPATDATGANAEDQG